MRKEEDRLAAMVSDEDEDDNQKYHQKERVFIEPIVYELAKDNKPVSTTVKTGWLSFITCNTSCCFTVFSFA